MELDFTRLDVMDTIIERITQSHAVLQGTGSFIDDETSKKLTKSIEKEGKRHIRRISKLARKVRKERKAAARQLMLEEQVDEAIEETAEIETVADETPVVQDEQQTQAEQAAQVDETIEQPAETDIEADEASAQVELQRQAEQAAQVWHENTTEEAESESTTDEDSRMIRRQGQGVSSLLAK